MPFDPWQHFIILFRMREGKIAVSAFSPICGKPTCEQNKGKSLCCVGLLVLWHTDFMHVAILREKILQLLLASRALQIWSLEVCHKANKQEQGCKAIAKGQ